MGIQSLWTALNCIKKSQSLLKLAEEHRLNAQSDGIEGKNATLTLGVDMGTCMAQCNAGVLAKGTGVNYQYAGAGLYIFFKMLTEYIKAPVLLVFVFDGSARPSRKRGHQVRVHQPIWWVQLAIELIKSFGYDIHQAPGEAEAELAELNRRGYIHGVITSDGDGVLYGIRTLLRSLPKEDRDYPDEYMVYTANTTGFTTGGLLLFALLCGGDYSNGLKGCGPTTASALAQCGFGDELLRGYGRFHGAEFDRYLIQWRCAVRTELMHNSRKFLSRCQPKIANAITDAFPDRRTLSLYICPITSWSPGCGHGRPDRNWQFRQPSIPAITRFCIQQFHWRDQEVIKKKMKKYLWEGISLQMLYSPSLTFNPKSQRLKHPDTIHADVLNISHQARRGKFQHAYGKKARPKLVVSTANFVDSMGPGFVGDSSSDCVTVWPTPEVPSQSFYTQLQLSFNSQKKNVQKNGATSGRLVRPHPCTSDGVKIGETSWFVDFSNN